MGRYSLVTMVEGLDVSMRDGQEEARSRRVVMRRLAGLALVAVGGTVLSPIATDANGQGKSKRQSKKRAKRQRNRNQGQNLEQPQEVEATACSPSNPLPCLPPPPTQPDLHFSTTSMIGYDSTLNRYYVDGVTVANRTSVAAGGFQVVYRVNGVTVKTHSIGSLAGYGKATLPRFVFSASFRPPSECASQSDSVLLVIDPNNQIRETLETNNTQKPVGIIC